MINNTERPPHPPFPGLFVDMPWLEDHLHDPDLRIIQIGGERYYPQMHIPGAALLSFRDLITIQNGVPGVRAAPEFLAELFGRVGVTLQTPVLFYDVGNGMDAARAVWTLTSLGHSAVAQLDGGFGLWFRDKRPMDHLSPSLPTLRFLPKPNPEWGVTGDEVLAISRSANGPILLDTRTPQEYEGLTAREPRGHIAGAHLFNWTDALREMQDPRIKPPEQLLSLLAPLGIVHPEQEIIVYCETGHRASHTWLLLRHLGFKKVRLYDGSMAEWRHLGYPVVAGSAPLATRQENNHV